jgi:hypothetical protein
MSREALWLGANPARLVCGSRLFQYRRMPLAKPNYHHAKKQRELARKTRQNEKQQRRSARVKAPDGSTPSDPAQDTAVAPGAPPVRGG